MPRHFLPNNLDELSSLPVLLAHAVAQVFADHRKEAYPFLRPRITDHPHHASQTACCRRGSRDFLACSMDRLGQRDQQILGLLAIENLEQVHQSLVARQPIEEGKTLAHCPRQPRDDFVRHCVPGRGDKLRDFDESLQVLGRH